MIVSTAITFQVIPWPSTESANNYLVYNGSNPSPVAQITNAAANEATSASATISYDDAVAGTIFIIRPVDDVNTPTQYGPSQSVVIGTMKNRGWLRSYVRKSMGDRADNSNTPTLSDDELNDFINDAIRDYSMKFPVQKDNEITLTTGNTVTDRVYPLPADVYEIVQVQYHRPDNTMDYYLKPMDWKGGETGTTNFVGFAKFGIWQSPLGGRYFPGNYYVWEGKLNIDFDPRGDGDTLKVRYKALYTLPLDDVTTLLIPDEDMELIQLYTLAQAWKEMESKDTLLSRWRTKDDGGRRDDMPTEKMSTRLFNAYQQKLKERLTLRLRHGRLVRRA